MRHRRRGMAAGEERRVGEVVAFRGDTISIAGLVAVVVASILHWRAMVEFLPLAGVCGGDSFVGATIDFDF